MVLAQISGHAEAGKAPPAALRLLFKSRYAIVTPDAPGMNISRSIRDQEVRAEIRAAAETEAAEASGYGLICGLPASRQTLQRFPGTLT